MDWNVIWQDVISGIIVAGVCGITAWIIYETGIRGKERGQIASERKKNIFIPLKYEMKRISMMADDIWQDICVEVALNIVDKEDEFVVDNDLYQQCQTLIHLIDEYKRINPYSIASEVLCNRFEAKFVELYGTMTHPVVHYDEFSQEEIEAEDYDSEIYMFRDIAHSRLNIKNIFKRRDLEEYCVATGSVGPAEEYLTEMFGHALPKQDKFKGGLFDNIKDSTLIERKITPSEYIAKNFDFFKAFDENEGIQKKSALLLKIKQIAFSIYELATVKIRNIGEKYEKE